MKRKRSEKETRHLREIVGTDGKKVHYFNPASPEDVRAYRERRRANQVAEMRKATGIKATAESKARELLKKPAAKIAAQVEEMRRRAGNRNTQTK